MNKTELRVLLVEDSPSDAALLCESLGLENSAGFTVTHAECWAQARQHLRQSAFDVMLLDLSLPDLSGRATFLCARAEAPALPIVVLSGMDDEAVGLDALRHGVQDYLTKRQADGRTVARAIRYAIERKQVETELRWAREELELRVRERTADLEQTVARLQAEIIQRREVEQALQESERRYRTLFETTPVGLGLTSRDGKVLAFNRELCVLAGVSAEEAKAAPAEFFYAVPAQRRRLLAQMRKAGKVEDQEVLFKKKDGSTLLGLVRMEEIRLGHEKVILTSVQDITRQKQADKHLAGVAALLKLFATRSSRKVYLGEAVKLLAGWCGCQCVAVRLLDEHDCLPYAAQTGFSRQFLKHEGQLCLAKGGCACARILTGRPKAEDAALRSPNGSLFCNHTSHFVAELAEAPRDCAQVACVNAGYESLAHTPICYRDRLLGTLHFADRRPDKFPAEIIAFIEATAPLIGEAIHRFKIEEALLESESRFRSMFERHEAMMLLIEPGSGAIVAANSAAATFYGYSGDQLRRMKIADLNQLHSEALTTCRWSALKEDGSFFVFPHRLANGQTRTVEVHSSPLRVKGQEMLFSIIHDITERKLLEKQVLEISEQERQRVGQDLHDSLGGKLTGAALIGKALARKLAKKDPGDAALALEVVQCINDSIGQTRSIARGLCPVELTVSGLAGGLADFASDTRRRSGVACQFLPAGQVQVHDVFVATHLFQIAQEAVTNAVRHSRARQITIHLTRAGEQLLLEVRDDGVGLPKDLEEAKGLGLRTMKYRANLIGAQLTVKPRQGGGTEVRCLLPQDKVPIN